MHRATRKRRKPVWDEEEAFRRFNEVIDFELYCLELEYSDKKGAAGGRPGRGGALAAPRTSDRRRGRPAMSLSPSVTLRPDQRPGIASLKSLTFSQTGPTLRAS